LAQFSAPPWETEVSDWSNSWRDAR